MAGAKRGVDYTIDDRHIFGRAVQQVACHIEYLLSYTFSRYLDATSTDIGGTGSIRAIVKYAGIGVNGVHDDFLHAYAQRLRGDLSEDCVAALPDIGSACHHVERPVFVKLDRSASQFKAGNSAALHRCCHASSPTDGFPIAMVKRFIPDKRRGCLLKTLRQAARAEMPL